MNNYFEFYNPVKVIYGKNSLEHLDFELEKKKLTNPLLLTNSLIMDRASGKANEYVRDYNKYIDIKECDIDSIIKIKELFKQNKNDCIIAWGDKTVIDIAKAASLMISFDTNDLQRFMGYETMNASGRVLLFVLPATIWSSGLKELIIKDKNGLCTIVSHYVLPDVVLISEHMLIDMKAKEIAKEGLFALSCAIESSNCLQRNLISENYSYTAMELISKNLIPSTQRPDKKDRIALLAQASILTQISINNSMVGLAYAIGQSAKEVAQVDCQQIMYMVMPYVMEHNLKECEKEYENILFHLGGRELYANTPRDKRAKLSVELFRQLMEKINDITSLEIHVRQTSLSQKDFIPLAEKVMSRYNTLFNPVSVTEDGIVNILKRAF